MKYTQVPSDLFKKIQINAGIIASTFEPETGTITATNILMATSGGCSFSAEPSRISAKILTMYLKTQWNSKKSNLLK